MNIVLTTNSPGEVAAWLLPTLRALRREAPQARISVFIPPCMFASGSECSVVSAMPEVDDVYGPREFIRLVMRGRLPVGFKVQATGAVCFLGGDLLHAVLLSRRLGLPAVAYTEGRASWSSTYHRFFVSDEAARSRALAYGAHADQVEVIGDLMLDAVQPHSDSVRKAKGLFGVPWNKTVVSLFPGSRPKEFRAMLPFMLRVAELVAYETDQPLHFLLSLAPFVTEETLKAAAKTIPDGMVGVEARVRPVSDAHRGLGKAAWLLDTGRAEVFAYQGLQYDVMLASDVALTLPGSNTAEMAYLGLPMVVLLPLNRPQDIPLEGLLGLMGRLPLVGGHLTRMAVFEAERKVDYVALPNRKAGEMLVPEVRGLLHPADTLVPMLSLLNDSKRREELSRQLREIMGEAGAADRLARAVVALASAH